MRAVPPRRARARPLFARVPAARADRRRSGDRRPQRRTPDHYHSEGRRPRCAAGGRGVKRLLVPALLIVLGFAAGSTITSRTRAAADAPLSPAAAAPIDAAAPPAVSADA